MTFDVYAFFNAQELAYAFNAVAMLVYSNGFTSLVRTLALVSILAVSIAVLAGRSRSDNMWKWFVMVALINGALIVPKASVMIYDKTYLSAPQKVDNVPLGLAASASFVTSIGNWMTNTFETIFAVPNDLKFSANGMMFGHKILEEQIAFDIGKYSMEWQNDFQEFWRECVTPELMNGNINYDMILNSQDLFSTMNGKMNPALYVQLSGGIVPCTTAVTNLQTKLVSMTASILQKWGQKIYPGENPTVAATKLGNALVTTNSTLLGISGFTASKIVEQAAARNAAVSAFCNTYAQMGNTEIMQECYATQNAILSTNFSQRIMRNVAEHSMPKLKSTIEIIQIAIFPIIAAFAIVGGAAALRVLSLYIMSLVWIQLWAPLYAILNFIMTSKAAAMGDKFKDIGLAINGKLPVFGAVSDDFAVAGTLVLAIPAIAAAIVRGGEVGMQAVAGALTPPRDAARDAYNTFQGNNTIGQWSEAPAIRTGNSRYSFVAPDGTVVNSFATLSATTTSDTYHRLGISGDLDNRIGYAIQREQQEAQRTAMQQVTAAGSAHASSYTQIANLVDMTKKGEVSQNAMHAINESGFAKSAEQMTQSVKSFAQKTGVTEEQAANILGKISAGLGFNASVFSAGLDANQVGSSGKRLREMFESGELNSDIQNYKEGFSKSRKALEDLSTNTNLGSLTQAVTGLNNQLSHTQTLTNTAQASLEKSYALSEAYRQFKENNAAFKVNAINMLVDYVDRTPELKQALMKGWMGVNPPASTADLIDKAVQNDPSLLNKLVDSFVPELLKNMNKVSGINDRGIDNASIQEIYNQNSGIVSNSVDPKAMFEQNSEPVRQTAERINAERVEQQNAVQGQTQNIKNTTEHNLNASKQELKNKEQKAQKVVESIIMAAQKGVVIDTQLNALSNLAPEVAAIAYYYDQKENQGKLFANAVTASKTAKMVIDQKYGGDIEKLIAENPVSERIARSLVGGVLGETRRENNPGHATASKPNSDAGKAFKGHVVSRAEIEAQQWQSAPNEQPGQVRVTEQQGQSTPYERRDQAVVQHELRNSPDWGIRGVVEQREPEPSGQGVQTASVPQSAAENNMPGKSGWDDLLSGKAKKVVQNSSFAAPQSINNETSETTSRDNSDPYSNSSPSRN